MKIIVDADACPVKEVIIDVALEFQIPVALISSISHVMPENEIVTVHWVEKRPQAADIKIINIATPNDIVITGDFGLAALVLGKGVKAISFRGQIYKNQQIDSLLESRYQSQKIRKAGGKTKGPKPFKQTDEDRFRSTLRNMIQSNLS